MKTNHEAETRGGVKEPVHLVWVPGQPGAVALRVCGLTQAEVMFDTEQEVEQLLRGFKWSVEASGFEPVCVVEDAEGSEPDASG